ncbi:MAG: stage II sporulation protein R [Clostridiales bacterium]|nr:stage II sporulation protein R [Clostridiales bacterium]
MKKLRIIGKKIVSILLSVAIFFGLPFIFSACIDNNNYEGELLRLHIRANSNDECDQAVKLKVRDAINKYVSTNVDKTTFDEAYADIESRLDELSEIADGVLRANGYTYGANAKLTNEYFPSRKYKEVTVPEGYYDALIVELGEAKGDNWWCVIYPPLCYGEDFQYKSFFAELFG